MIKKTEYYLYSEGLKDMMECWKYILKMPEKDISEYFGFNWKEKISELNADEFIEKIKEYKSKKEIKVEDIVIHNVYNNGKGVVTKVNDESAEVLWGSGSSGTYYKCDLTKTGERCYIKSILELLKGE